MNSVAGITFPADEGQARRTMITAALRKFYDIAWTLADARRKPEAFRERATDASEENNTLCWIHACSLGETSVALRLIAELRALDPTISYVLSASTRDGLALASASHAENVIRFPCDSPTAMKRVFDRLNPSLVVLVEAEIWPNHLRQASKRNVPVFLVNGRMTQNEFRRYRVVRRFMAEAFGTLDTVFAQTAADAGRFQALGAPNVVVTGNMKSDPPMDLAEQLPASCAWLEGYASPIVLGASTHQGEEKILLEWLTRTRTPSRPVLILAPRHISRTRNIINLAKRYGFRAETASASTGPCEVVVVDVVGKLRPFYKVTSVCFVGKSLCARGGQNPWEPLQSGCPAIFGPHMENFAEEADMLLRCGAAGQVDDGNELFAAIERLISDQAARANMVDGGAALLASRPNVAATVASQILHSMAYRVLPRVYPSGAPC